ncbi:MAG TPA: flagellar hook-length control protein FliK [Gemmatimonadaceae bacterium]|nr:flagellar hook-length control protein FliK [Gemmatimonadaceae bacterium]
MSLPIPMVRPSAEPPSARPGNEPAPTEAQGREFRTALANAVHDASKSGESGRTRRSRAPRATESGPSATATSHAPGEPHVIADGETTPRVGTAGEATTRVGDGEATIAASAGGETSVEAPRELATMPLRDPETGAMTAGRESPHDARPSLAGTSAASMATRGERLPIDVSGANGARPLAASAGDEATATADAASDDVATEPAPDASALADRFVASSLEAAIAPLAPLTLAASATPPAAIVPTDPGTRPASSPASTSPHAPLSLSGRDERPEHEARLAGIAAAVARNPLAVRREVEALVPELRQRLDRVIDRMEQEYGYTVEVVETVRTQERQDALFAQGRTTEGPIVTWTRNSRHLGGAAADVVIDGGYDSAAGFERLARVAREEGLKTLWPRDPGHVELAPNAAAVASRVARTSDGEAVILPAATTPAPGAAIPRAVRAGIDPAATPRASMRPTLGSEGTHVPAPAGDAHILPFPAGGIPRLDGDGDMRALPLRGTVPAHPASGAVPGQVMDATPSGVTVPLTPAAAGRSGGGVAHVASVAPVATVAQVAQVAQVARVAEVATVGEAAGPAGTAPSAPATIVPAPTLAREASTREGGRDGHRSSGERGERERAEALANAVVSREDREPTRLPFARESVVVEGAESGASTSVAGLSRSDATERIARVLRLQESAGDRPLSSVLLRLDHPDGGEDRIRIDLRGHSVGATLDVADPRAAEQLRLHVTELQEALQRQGLEGEAMVVRTAQRTTDASTLTATAIAAERDVLRTASASASDGGGSTAKDSRNPSRAPFEREFEREGTDQQRSRQRRDGKGDSR